MSASPIPAAVSAAAAGDVAQFLRGDPAAEPALLARTAAAAIALAEGYCGSVLIARGGEEIVPADGGWHALAAVPVTAIDGVTLLTAGDAPAVDGYAVDIDAEGRGWVRIAAAAGGARAAVAYRAGIAVDWASVPPALAQGVVMLAAHLFENRDGGGDPPAAVAALWRPYRRMRLGAAAVRA